MASIVQSFDVSSSFGWTVANATVCAFAAIGRRKSPNGLNAVVVPMYCDELGLKIGSFWLRMRLNRLAETCLPVCVLSISL